LRECWLAHERLRVAEARSMNRAEILTACTTVTTEAAEVAAAETAAAEAAAAVEAVAAEEAAAAAGAAAKTAADTLGARAALASDLIKEPGGGAYGMAEDAEEIPGRPVFSVGPQRNLKLEAGRTAAREQTRQSRPRVQHRSKF
jgi:hypothetical protein